MKPHPHTAALVRAAEMLPGLRPHERARFAWLAWVHFSSRSRRNVGYLLS